MPYESLMNLQRILKDLDNDFTTNRTRVYKIEGVCVRVFIVLRIAQCGM